MTYAFDSAPPAGTAIPPLTLDLLVADPSASSYTNVLRDTFRLTLTGEGGEAIRQLRFVSPTAVLTELDLPDHLALELCRRARENESHPSVLVTTSDPARVPDALLAGCDSVLLKPFAPNLLRSRLSRLTKVRTQQLRYKAELQRSKAAHLRERSLLIMDGCNVEWPTTHCPRCDHQGVTTFDFASHRRAWFACLACKNVWIAKRPE